MRPHSFAVVGLTATVLLTACGAPTNTNPNVRNGPQTQHPVTFGPNHTPATPGQALVAAGGLERLLADTGISADELGDTLFPSASGADSLSKPITLFQSACLTSPTNFSKIAQVGAQNGLDVERPAPDQVFAVEWTDTSFVSLQVNIASSYAYECATSGTAAQNVSTQQVRDMFFSAIGLSHANGTGATTIGGKAYQVRHLVMDGGGLGVNEHAFLLQAN